MSTAPADLSVSKAQFKAKFELWLKSSQLNAWIADERGIFNFYVRKGRHVVEDEIVSTLDVANVKISEGYQRKGQGDSMLQYLHDVNPYDATYIENVINPGWAVHLTETKWKPADRRSQSGLSPCLFKYTNKVFCK